MTSLLIHEIHRRPLVLDGAMGTMIATRLPDSERGEDLLLRRPDVIESIHSDYVKAGSDIIITATFGANAISLADHDLTSKMRALTEAGIACAKKAAAKGTKKVFIAGGIGPTSKLPSLGHISFDEMFSAYKAQIDILITGGVDAIIFETCQDPMQLRIGLSAARQAMNDAGRMVPLLASITLEKNGKMLLGTEVGAALATVLPFRPLAFGLNCATGPKAMEPYLEYLHQNSSAGILCEPNAGMPEVIDGQTKYKMSPEEFSETLGDYCERFKMAIVGGCCGTTPDHVSAIAKRLAKKTYVPQIKRHGSFASVSSLYEPISLDQEPKPFIVAEQTNVNGSKAFRNLLEAEDFSAMVESARTAVRGGHALDICLAVPGRNEVEDFSKFCEMLGSKVEGSIMIDSTDPLVVDAALKKNPGRAIINSINLEDGGEKAKKILEIAAKHGSAVVALCIDEDGMAKTAEKKFEVAARLVGLASSYGIMPDSILIDCLTFTLASGDKETKSSAAETLRAIGLVKRELGAKTILGVSNVSFGLQANGRKILTSVFLQKAIEAGLDAAIVNPKKLLPLDAIDEEPRILCEQMIFYSESKDDPLTKFLNYLSKNDPKKETFVSRSDSQKPEDLLREKVLAGSRDGLLSIVEDLILKIEPRDIINRILMPAMQEVGRRFGEGRLALPFVLESAETMRAGIDAVSQYMKGEKDERVGTIVLATVRGDVHDIGKNLVDAILSNNGFHVVNLGIRQPANAIIEAVKLHNADAIGLSGLIVNSVHVMKEDLATFKENGISIPVLCGGAALTRKYTKEVLEPEYGSHVFYCEDAFAGLSAMQEIFSETKLNEK